MAKDLTSHNGGSCGAPITVAPKKTSKVLSVRPGLIMGRRRSVSEPPSGRQRPHPRTEEHYRVDDARTVVLPGVSKHEDDWARDAHDFFNLVVLIPVVVLNIMNWNWDMLLDMPNDMKIEDAWTGEWFNTFFSYTLIYFVLDLLWVIATPSCVRSPMTIILHHISAILVMIIPYNFFELRFLMGALLSVEINTWFLIARRVFNKQGLPPWTINLPPILSIRVKLISICFYITWITTRCIIYPALFIYGLKRYQERSEFYGTPFNVITVCIPIQGCFVALNFKWTYDLIMSKVRYWRKKETSKKDDVSKGL